MVAAAHRLALRFERHENSAVVTLDQEQHPLASGQFERSLVGVDINDTVAVDLNDDVARAYAGARRLK